MMLPFCCNRFFTGRSDSPKKWTTGLIFLLAVLIACGEAPPPEYIAGGPVQFEVRAGETVSRWCARLDGTPLRCSVVAEIARDNAIFEGLPFAPPAVSDGAPNSLARFEGLFVPGPYRFEAGESAPDMLRFMLERGADRFEGMENAAGENTPRLDLRAYERLILASIVEKEAVANRKYERVASVFLNRLAKNDYLGSCPTVEYALGYHRAFLLLDDLKLDSPYNAYRRRGLPPTPIAFFSDGALAAALRPANTDDYFFVFDWTRSKLTFAVDYEDHERNANVARANFVQRYGREAMYKEHPGVFYEVIAR